MSFIYIGLFIDSFADTSFTAMGVGDMSRIHFLLLHSLLLFAEKFRIVIQNRSMNAFSDMIITLERHRLFEEILEVPFDHAMIHRRK